MKPSDTSKNYLDLLMEFENPDIARKLLDKISSFREKLAIMEVCGTHTVEIFRTGIRNALPANINLISGPGCPVCVTPTQAMEKAIGLACKKDTFLFCFGDMIRVPGVRNSLESARAEKSANLRLIYSPIEALEFARSEPAKSVVLFGVGFETTIPLFASVIARAKKEGIKNLYLLCAFKLIPPALELLLSSQDNRIDGFLLPGHVSSIIGERAYDDIFKNYRAPGVITGFKPVDILEGILISLEMITRKEPGIRNAYSRFVPQEGNKKARDLIESVFTVTDSEWRGLGKIKSSGLRLKEDFSEFDAEALVDFDIGAIREPQGCLCGEVIKGASKPTDCKLFATACTPLDPIGPCMVSSEGTCAAYYKYGKR